MMNHIQVRGNRKSAIIKFEPILVATKKPW